MSKIGKKIVIIGVTGAGKTTLAKEISQRKGLPLYDLDDLYWLPEWQHHDQPAFRENINKALSADTWITTGNYSKVRDLTWDRADTLIWLDYKFTTAFRRLISRTFRRIFTGETCCNGNTENLKTAFVSDGIIPWLLKTYRPRKLEYSKIFENKDQYSSLKKIRLRNQEETNQFIRSLSK